jgi:hypothetical protein
MQRDELLNRLQNFKERGNHALSILEASPQTPATEAEVRTIAEWLRNELQAEFLRTSPERVQKQMTIFEMSVYAPTIEEAWKQSGISRLKIEGAPTKKWAEVIEAVVYTSCKYMS